MSKITLSANVAGTAVFTVAAPGTSVDRTLALPDATGTLGIMQQGTAQATTSGSSIDFTGIPSWAKRVTVALSSVSTSGTNQVQIQLGTSGGIETASYSGGVDGSSSAGAVAAATVTTGLGLERSGLAAAASVRSGIATFVNMGGNLWVGTWLGARTDSACILWGSAAKTLSGVLDRLRLTTVGGTDTFDAGSVNIVWEG